MIVIFWFFKITVKKWDFCKLIFHAKCYKCEEDDEISSCEQKSK